MENWVEIFAKDQLFLTASLILSVCDPLGPIYTKYQHQRCGESAMMLAILFSLKTIESLQDGAAIHF